MNKRAWIIIGSVLFMTAVLLTIFLHIDYCGIYRWDESRNAMNALEMSEGGNPLIRTIFGYPDHWETKPPLLIWLQVVFIKILGISELSIRLPSAISGLALCAVILKFFKNHIGDTRAGIFSVLVLFTSMGYVRPHVLRSGDHDALLVFWLTTALLLYFSFLESEGKDSNRSTIGGKPLLWAGLSVTAAVLTKSITGLFFLPGMLLFTVLAGKLKVLFRSRWLYAGLGVFILLVGGYYLGRSCFDPEYLYWVNENELFKRYFNVSTEYSYNEPSRWYYLHLLKSLHFRYWVWVLPLVLVPLISPDDARSRRLTFYLSLNSLVFFIIISMGTSNDWYDAPLIPMLSMLLGIAMSRIYQLLAGRLSFLTGRFSYPGFIFIVIMIFAYPYYNTIRSQVYQPQPVNSDMAYGNFLRTLTEEQKDLRSFSIISECNNTHTDFYIKVYNEYKGYQLTNRFICSGDASEEIQSLVPGGRFAVCSDHYKELINASWHYDIIVSEDNCLYIQLSKRR